MQAFAPVHCPGDCVVKALCGPSIHVGRGESFFVSVGKGADCSDSTETVPAYSKPVGRLIEPDLGMFGGFPRSDLQRNELCAFYYLRSFDLVATELFDHIFKKRGDIACSTLAGKKFKLVESQHWSCNRRLELWLIGHDWYQLFSRLEIATSHQCVCPNHVVPESFCFVCCTT